MMIDALYHSFNWLFWPVMLWGLLSAIAQRRNDLMRVVAINIVGQLAGFAILWFESRTGLHVARWFYYAVQFAAFSWFVTRPPATWLCGAVSSASVAGFILAIIYKLSGANSPDMLFHMMMAISIMLLAIIIGAASGTTGARLLAYIRRGFGGLASSPDRGSLQR